MDEGKKRKLYSVRLDPADRSRVEAFAEREGVGVGAAIEQLAVAQLDLLERTDVETRNLLDDICDLIEGLQSTIKRKWYESLPTWAALSEAMRHVLDPYNPEPVFEDERVKPKLEEKRSLEEIRGHLVTELSRLGVAVNKDPSPRIQISEQRLGEALEFAKGQALKYMPTATSRSWEIKAIEALPEEQGRQTAKELFQKICELDEQIEATKKVAFEEARLLVEAEEDGRRIGRQFVADAQLQGTQGGK